MKIDKHGKCARCGKGKLLWVVETKEDGIHHIHGPSPEHDWFGTWMGLCAVLLWGILVVLGVMVTLREASGAWGWPW